MVITGRFLACCATLVAFAASAQPSLGTIPPPRCGAVVADPRRSSPHAENLFEVDFQGIIAFVKPRPDSNYRQALVVDSSFSIAHVGKSTRSFGMTHKPLLFVRDTVDLSSLATAARAEVTCFNGRCSIPINGQAFRIRAVASNGDVQCAYNEGANFKEDLESLPHLSRLKGISVMPDSPAFDDTVNSMEAGVFELEGGYGIAAEPFPHQTGLFVASDGVTRIPYIEDDGTESVRCRKFANVTSWSGRADGRAVLEINSSGHMADPSAWKRVRFNVPEKLWVGVQNLSEVPTPDPTHFRLFSRLMVHNNLPQVCPCDANGDPVCEANQAQMKHMNRTLLLGVAAPLNYVVGCSDTGWP
jgi:hypothetical protein